MPRFSPLTFMQGVGHRALRAGRRFARAQDGASAVEFSLIALPFIATMFAIIQTALVFFAGQALETAGGNASRLIFTGQAQGSSYSAADFKSAVCAQVTSLFDCTNKLYVDVQKYTSFSSVNTAPPVSGGNFDASGLGYNPGSNGDIVMVRLYYQWPIYVRILGLQALVNVTATNSNLLVATAVFRNEPFVGTNP